MTTTTPKIDLTTAFKRFSQALAKMVYSDPVKQARCAAGLDPLRDGPLPWSIFNDRAKRFTTLRAASRGTIKKIERSRERVRKNDRLAADRMTEARHAAATLEAASAVWQMISLAQSATPETR